MRRVLYLIIILLITCHFAFSQSNRLKLPSLSENFNQQERKEYPVSTVCYKKPTLKMMFPYKSKLPFFCSLEEQQQKKYRFFLVLRTGDDESYRKMIRN